MPTETSDSQRRAIFFDRDGVVNQRIVGGYVRNWSEFKLLPGVAKVLREIKRRGYLAIIITNQRGVGMGLMSELDLQKIHDELQALMVREAGNTFDDIFVATDIDDTSGRRKPSPTMLLEAAAKWNIDLMNSWMIGDSASDIEAGRGAGTNTAYVVTPHSEGIPVSTAVVCELTEILGLI